MIYPYGNLKLPAPFSDVSVDITPDQDGVIDQYGLLDLKISDARLIENLNERIEDSRSYYNDPTGFNLENRRAEALRMYLGEQADASDFYDQEDPYVENQIRKAVDSVVSYATARSPQSVVTPADDTPQAKKFATNLEKAHNMHSVEFDLRGLLEVQVRSWFMNQEGYLLLEFDPDYGENGEIIPRFLHPDECVVDKNWRFGQPMPMFTYFEKKTIEDLLYTYPEKATEILGSIGAVKPGKRNVTRTVVIKKSWFRYYNPKTGTSEVGFAVHYDKVMLMKIRDPNWLHGQKNFLKQQMIPVIPLQVLSDGKHGVDFSNPLDDGIKLQRLINSRGKQISLNALRSNGTIIVDGAKSGLTKEDVENWTLGPNQKIFLKKMKDGVDPKSVIWRLEGQDIKPFVIEQQKDLRSVLGDIMGVPMDQSGSDLTGDDTTLGQQLLKKSNDNARQDMIVRAIDRELYLYFNLLTQMMFRWYDDEHFFPYLDSDGSFENIVIKRYYFDDGLRVNVKGLSTIAWDKNREQAMATHLVDHNGISHLDYYRIAGFENPQKLYDNWVKESKNPYELVRDANNAYDSGDAYAEFLDLLGGKDVKPKQEADKDYILTLRKLMFTDKYLTADAKTQERIMERVKRYLDLYELRTSLDQMSQMDIDKLMPGQPIAPPMSEQQFAQMQHPPMPPQLPAGQPGAPAPAMPPGMPPMGALPPQFQRPPVPTAGSMFAGTGLMAPGSAQPQSGISAIPSI